MSFKINSLYLSDGYKVGHKAMLAPGTTKLYGTWIPRSTKHAPKGITKIVSFGQQLVWKWLHDEFEENFFFTEDRTTFAGNIPIIGGKVLKDATNNKLKEKALQFIKDMSLYLGMEYDGKHFEELWDLDLITYSQTERLFEWKIDVFGLIEAGLAEPVTGNFNPYK